MKKNIFLLLLILTIFIFKLNADIIEDYLSLAQKSESTKNFEKAAEYYEKIDYEIKKEEMYLKAAQKEEKVASSWFSDDASGDDYWRSKAFGRASNFYLKARDYEKSREMVFRKEEELRCLPEKIADFIFELKEFFNGYSLATQEAEKFEEQEGYKCQPAAYFYEIAGNKLKVKEIFLRLAKHFENEKNFADSAYYYEKLGDLKKKKEICLQAAKDYENTGDIKKAAYFYEKADYKEKAQECLVRLGIKNILTK